MLATDERYVAAHKLSLKDIRGVVPVSAFYWVERTDVAPSRDKSVWGTDTKVWVDASPALHVRKDAPPMLMLYADGDDEWRRAQNAEMVQVVKKVGAPAEIVQIAGRTHNSIWSKVAEPGDEAAERIVAFIRSRTAASTNERAPK